MNNTIARSLNDLFTSGEKAADGLDAHEATIGIMHNTEAVTLADLAAARTANNAFQAKKSARLAATEAQETADGKAVAFITSARDFLKRQLGSRYSQAWDEAGFTSQSLAVPGTIAKRMELLMSLQLYLAAHPEQEVAGALITSAEALARHTELSDAVSAMNAAKSDQRGTRDARDTAAETLRNRLRGLVSELTQLTGKDDVRWLDFGFRIPGDDRTPDVVYGLIVAGGAAGHLVANWPPAARADRYRVYKQVVGVDDDFVLAATVTDTDADLNTFTPGAQVRTRVTAVNRIGESQPSEIVEQTVP